MLSRTAPLHTGREGTVEGSEEEPTVMVPGRGGGVGVRATQSMRYLKLEWIGERSKGIGGVTVRWRGGVRPTCVLSDEGRLVQGPGAPHLEGMV